VRSNERVGSPTLTADGSAIVFRSDRGADENWSFFRLDLAGGEVVELPPGETLQRDAARLVDSRGSADLYLLDAATGAASPLRGEPRASLAGWTPPRVKLETTAAFDGLAIPLNAYLPAGAVAVRGGRQRQEAPRPFPRHRDQRIAEPQGRFSSQRRRV